MRTIDQIFPNLVGGGSSLPVPWNVDPLTAAVSASEATGATIAAAGTPNRQTITPNGPLFELTPPGGFYAAIAASSNPYTNDGTVWTEMVVPTNDPGDDITFASLFARPSTTTFEQISAALFGAGGPGDYVAMLQVSLASGGMQVVVADDGVNSAVTATATCQAGDTVYFGFNKDTGQCYVKVGSNPQELVQTIQGDTSNLDFVMGIALTAVAETPVFAAGSVEFSLTNTNGGLTSPTAVSDNTPPTGAKDGDRFLITGQGGQVNGKSFGPGDVVEFFGDTSNIIVTPGDFSQFSKLTLSDVQTQVSSALAVAPLYGTIEQFKDRPAVWGIKNDTPTSSYWVAPQDGDGVIVGPTPAGDWSGYAPGTLLVKDGDEWVEFSPHSGMRFDRIVNTSAVSSAPPVMQGTQLVYVDDSDPSGPLGEQLEYGGTPIPNWYIVERYPAPVSAKEVTLTDGQTHDVDMALLRERLLYISATGNVTVDLTQDWPAEGVGLLYLVAGGGAGNPTVFNFDVSGESTFFGFREPGVGNNTARVRLRGGEVTVVQWTKLADRGAQVSVVGTAKEFTQTGALPLDRGLSADTVKTIDKAYSHLTVSASISGDASKPLELEFPFEGIWGAPMFIEFQLDMDDLTWTDTSSNPDQAAMSVFPTKVKTGEQYMVWGGASGWHVQRIVDPAPGREVKVQNSADTYTYVSKDRDLNIQHDRVSDITVTVPAESAVDFPIGTILRGWQQNTGQVAIQGDSGVTVNAFNNNNKTSGQYAEYELEKVGTDTWILRGNLTTAI